jgi:hypothetical protein
MSFDQPKFEYNINDKWTIYERNKVGCTNRGIVAYNPGSGELIVDAAFMAGAGANLHNLQEIIDYADGLSYTTITIDLNTTYNENNLNLPASTTLQVEDGRTIIINIEDFVQSRISNTDISSDLKHGAIKGSKSGSMDKYSPLITDGDTVYCLNEDGDWDTYTHSNISGHSYIDITHQELALVLDTTVKYYHENTLINSDMNTLFGVNVEQADPYMRYIDEMITGPTTDAEVLFIKLVNIYRVGYVYDGSFPPGTTNNGYITIKDEDGNTFSNCENWDITYWHKDTSYAPYLEENFQLAYGEVNNTYKTYIYVQEGNETDSFTLTAFQDSHIDKIINTKLIKCDWVKVLSTSTFSNSEDYIYYGGQQIWKYDLSQNYTYEHLFDFEVKNFDFIQHYSGGGTDDGLYCDVLYCVASNDDIGICEIWSKDLIDENSVWTLVKRYNEPLIYMSSYYKVSEQLLRIILKNADSGDVYHYINKTLVLERESVLTGFEINNNMGITDFGTDETGYPFNPRALIESNFEDPEITYCNLNSADLPTTNGLWTINNCIIKSNTDGMYYRGDKDPTFTGDCRENLFICGEYALRLEIKDDDTITFSSAVFEHNTVHSTNGLLLNSISSQLDLRNLIINAQNTAIYIKGNYSSITVYNSIVNGILDSDVTLDSTCYQDVAPLFKDISNEDFQLMSIAEGYPKDSKAIDLSTTGIDSGCYNISREKLPLLHWGLQEVSGTVVYDTGLLDEDGTNSGAVVNQTGVSAGHLCYQFDTVTDNITSDSEIYNSAETTLSFWIKTSAASGDIIKLDNGTSYQDFYLYLSSGALVCNVERFNTTSQSVTTSAINDGNWHHIVFKINSTDDYISVKVDNILIDIADSLPDMIINLGNLIVGDTSSAALMYIENIILFNYITSDQADTNLYNNGEGTLGFDSELDKKTIEYVNYKTDVNYEYQTPYSGDSFDYEGNYKKNTGEQVKIITLLSISNERLKTARELENLVFIDDPIRFYPFNTTGEKYLLHYNSDNKIIYESSGTLYIDFINMKAYAESGYFFQVGTLKNAYLTVTISATDYDFRIITNTDQIIEIENVNEYTSLTSGSYTCQILFYYVKTSTDIESNNKMWDWTNQAGKTPALKLYTVEEKDS